MHSEGEEVKLNLEAEWQYEDLVLMAIDDGEEDWSRLHDVRINGMVGMGVVRGRGGGGVVVGGKGIGKPGMDHGEED